MKNFLYFLASFTFFGLLVLSTAFVHAADIQQKAVSIIENYDTKTKIGVRVVQGHDNFIIPVNHNKDIWNAGSDIPNVRRWIEKEIEPVFKYINSKLNPEWLRLFSHSVVKL